MSVFKKILVLFFLLGSPLCLAANSLDKIVAVVNDGVITQSQLNQQIAVAQQQLPPGTSLSAAELQQKVLQQMIDIELQLQLAKKMGITVSNTAVDQAIANIAKKNGLSVAELQTKITEQGLMYNQYRQEIQKEMIISQLQQQQLGSTIVITDQEVKDLAPTLKKSTPNDEVFHVLDILIPTSTDSAQQAQNLLGQLRTNKNFQFVIGQFPAAQMQDLNASTLANLPDLFIPYVQKMHAGEFAGPIEAPNGLHIIKLISVQGGDSPMPSGEQAKRMVYAQKFQQAVEAWLESLRSQAYIKRL